MDELPKDAAGTGPAPSEPEDYEPTIRMPLPDRTATTRTRRITPPPSVAATPAADEPPFEHAEKSAVGAILEHLTEFFRRRGGTIEPVPASERPTNVSLDPTDSEMFPPLENAFERGEELGAGGQAKLYRGFDLHLRRQAAVKSLRPEQCKVPELREKFISEAMITAQLDHPAIVPVYSIHRDRDNRLHLAMKLVNGRPFQKYLGDLVRHYDRDGFSAREEKRSLDYRLEVFLAVCDALEYAHNRNIMHCDLKPENI
ncbi:MAG: protein kinase, partial [Lentisphaeria bacterium]|nr:protein kinase [Lentisphaeria bacterium]